MMAEQEPKKQRAPRCKKCGAPMKSLYTSTPTKIDGKWHNAPKIGYACSECKRAVMDYDLLNIPRRRPKKCFRCQGKYESFQDHLKEYHPDEDIEIL